MPPPGSSAHFEPGDVRHDVMRRHARVIAERADADTPLTAAHAFRPPADLTPAQGLGLLAAMALVLLSGLASGSVADWLGVRLFALVLLAFAAGATFELAGLTIGGHRSSPLFERTLLFGTLAVAIATGSATALMLLPAIVHAAVARVMLESLDAEITFIERGARISHPLAPDFIRPYCRALTVAWSVMFAASAVVVTVLALGGWTQAHRIWTGWLLWTLATAFCVAEFFFRKARFRYFGRGPFDQLLARAFPPENTERGRRSLAYVTKMREELASMAEAERRAGMQRAQARDDGIPAVPQ